MTLDLAHFTPWESLAGGLLLGLAAAMFILLNGRVVGISGIIGGLVRPRPGDAGWRLAFLAGMLVAPTVWSLFALPAAARIAAGPTLLVAAGLLVGWGARFGSGCTSGHGVCGLSRLSPRSLVATLAFMGTGFGAVFVLRHVAG
ncbi:MAG: YeeE/YedE family protein [Burkholderiales bacterium]|nr:YeeE/YedE family protein [Burkholderiales bacterium]